MGMFMLNDEQIRSFLVLAPLLCVIAVVVAIIFWVTKKHRLKLFEDSKGTLALEIVGDFSARFEAPFEYQFVLDLLHTPNGPKQQLTFYLKDSIKAILVKEILQPSKLKVQPLWPKSTSLHVEGHPTELVQGKSRKLNLRELKKILDGLSERKDK